MPQSELQEMLDQLAEVKPRTIRQMLYRIAYLLVLRVEVRVEGKTKEVWRKVHDAVRPEH